MVIKWLKPFRKFLLGTSYHMLCYISMKGFQAVIACCVLAFDECSFWILQRGNWFWSLHARFCKREWWAHQTCMKVFQDEMAFVRHTHLWNVARGLKIKIWILKFEKKIILENDLADDDGAWDLQAAKFAMRFGTNSPLALTFSVHFWSFCV